MREMGTATLGINVARTFRRKTNTTRITSSTDTISVSSTSCTEARMVVVRSIATPKWMDWGMAARRNGSRARMWSTVSMMLAFGCRQTMTSTEGLPLA